MSAQPNKVYTLALGYVTAKVVSLAATLMLDQRIDQTGILIKDLAQQLHFHPSALRHFLQVLAAHEIVAIEQDTVSSTALTQQLADVRSPHFARMYTAFDDLTHTLETNQPCWDHVFGQAFYPSLSAEELVQFAAWCEHSGDGWLPGIFTYYDFSPYQTIVDIGGGQGHLLSQILAKHPGQRGILFDQAPVIAQAETTLSQRNCLERMDLVAGDFFAAVPTTGDLYIILVVRSLIGAMKMRSVYSMCVRLACQSMPSYWCLILFYLRLGIRTIYEQH